MSALRWLVRVFCRVTWHRWPAVSLTHDMNPDDVRCERCDLSLREWWWTP